MAFPRGGAGGRGGGFRGGRGGPGGRGGGRAPREASGVVVELGEYSHSTPNALFFNSTCTDVPMFNQPVLNSDRNGSPLGRVDEILGPVGKYMFTAIPAEGIKLDSLQKGKKVYIDRAFLLPLDRFLNPGKPTSFGAGRGRGGAPGGFRGGRGAPRGGRGW